MSLRIFSAAQIFFVVKFSWYSSLALSWRGLALSQHGLVMAWPGHVMAWPGLLWREVARYGVACLGYYLGMLEYAWVFGYARVLLGYCSDIARVFLGYARVLISHYSIRDYQVKQFNPVL